MHKKLIYVLFSFRFIDAIVLFEQSDYRIELIWSHSCAFFFFLSSVTQSLAPSTNVGTISRFSVVSADLFPQSSNSFWVP